MTLIEATRTCLKNKYFIFSGRASRAEFWKFMLFIFLGSVVCTLLNSILFGPNVEDMLEVSVSSNGDQSQNMHRQTRYDGGWFEAIFLAFCLLPSVAVAIRRLHDTDRTGWFVLLPVIGFAVGFTVIDASLVEVALDPNPLPEGTGLPTHVSVPGNTALFVAGWFAAMGSVIALCVSLTKKSQVGPNQYGPNPHEVTP